MTEPDPIPGVTPCLAIDGRAGNACDVYIRAFAAEDTGRMKARVQPLDLAATEPGRRTT